MEDISKKAEEDELNITKAEEFGKAPKRFIPVPKVKGNKEKSKNNGNVKK
jgi:hypothetical protein